VAVLRIDFLIDLNQGRPFSDLSDDLMSDVFFDGGNEWLAREGFTSRAGMLSNRDEKANHYNC